MMRSLVTGVTCVPTGMVRGSKPVECPLHCCTLEHHCLKMAKLAEDGLLGGLLGCLVVLLACDTGARRGLPEAYLESRPCVTALRCVMKLRGARGSWKEVAAGGPAPLRGGGKRGLDDQDGGDDGGGSTKRGAFGSGKGEEVSKTPEDISEGNDGEEGGRGTDDDDIDEILRGKGKDADENEDQDDDDDDDDEGKDYFHNDVPDNTMAGLVQAQQDIDRALSLLEQAKSTVPLPLEVDPETLKQRAAQEDLEEIPQDFLDQLDQLEEEGGLATGDENRAQDGQSESAENSDEVAVDEINPETFGMKFLTNEKERVGRAKAELLEAVQEGDEAGVRRAIRRGAPVNAADPAMHGWTPLHYAAERGDCEIMKILISLGANISSVSNMMTTALHIACQNEQEEAVELLVQNNSDVSARNEGEYTPFLMAAGKGKITIPRYLIRRGASINEVTYCGNNALHLAATHGHEHMVLGLLDLGIDPNATNDHKRTALHHAALRDMHQAVKVLLEAGADPSLQDEEGETPLHSAASRGGLATLEILVKNISQELLLVEDSQNRTALERARIAGEGLCTSVLWEKMGRPGGSIDVLPRPKTPLEKDEEFCKLLWETYKAHRNESFFGGISPADDITLFLRAKKRLNGAPEKVIKEEDMFVIRKGVREYVMDKPEQRKMLLDREEKKEIKALGR